MQMIPALGAPAETGLERIPVPSSRAAWIPSEGGAMGFATTP